MDIINKVKGWAGALAEVGLSIAALMIVVEVLGLGNIPFFPEVSVVSNVSGMLFNSRCRRPNGLDCYLGAICNMAEEVI